jgi:prepilin-type processing-associated H-X9-DG protein
MRRLINVLILVLVLVVAGGLVVAAVAHMREASARAECVNRLREIALGLHNYHGTYNRLPQATIACDSLAPEQRLSWLVESLPFIEQTGLLLLDRKRAWDDEPNREPKVREWGEDAAGKDRLQDVTLGELRLFRCPANPASAPAGTPGLTHYVGITGLGPDAATRGLGYPGTGVFGYDRKVSFEDIKDGLANTMVVIETTRKNSPWTAGGFPTARGLDPAGGPYLGSGGQFASNHRGTNAAFADGSVRSLAADIRPEVLEAMATVAGGEEVGTIGDE